MTNLLLISAVVLCIILLLPPRDRLAFVVVLARRAGIGLAR